MELGIGLLIVRIALGLGFASHGAQKLFGWFGGYGLAGTGGFMESLGFKPGKTFAAAAGASELAGGLLIAAGLLGPVGPALVLSTMLVATITVHLKNGFFNANGGYELPFAYTAGSLAYAFAGYGALSLDSALHLAWSPAIVYSVLALGAIGAFANLALRKPAPAGQATNA